MLAWGFFPDYGNFVMAWLSAKQDDAAAVGLAGILRSGGCGSGEIGEILVTGRSNVCVPD